MSAAATQTSFVKPKPWYWCCFGFGPVLRVLLLRVGFVGRGVPCTRAGMLMCSPCFGTRSVGFLGLLCSWGGGVRKRN